MSEFEREPIIANMERTWDSLSGLYRSLSPDQWDAQTLCPGWTSRHVAAHMASVEVALSGWEPSADNPPPFDRVAPAHREIMAVDADGLADHLRGIYDRRLAELADIGQDVFDTPAMTPVGMATFGRFMAVRVFDAWVHERDISIPQGIATDDGGPTAEMTLDEVQRTIGYIAGKKIGLGEGQSIWFQVRGPVERDIYVAVDGRAAEVDAVADPTVTLTAQSPVFVMLACGRIDPQGPIDEGTIGWAGDAELGERAARNLAFTQ